MPIIVRIDILRSMTANGSRDLRLQTSGTLKAEFHKSKSERARPKTSRGLELPASSVCYPSIAITI